MNRRELVQRRIMLGLKQEELVDIIKSKVPNVRVSGSTLSRWENGPTPIPDYVEAIMDQLATRTRDSNWHKQPRTFQTWEKIDE